MEKGDGELSRMDDVSNRTKINQEWARFLEGTDPLLRLGRSIFRHLPSPPRCKLCNAPFSGPFTPLMRAIGKRPWNRNPQLCQFCATWLMRRGPGGAEITLTLLFADVRGSTSLAEKMSPDQFSQLIGRFFHAATHAFAQRGAIVDQLVGDEAIGLFLPAYAGPFHARRAIEAARILLRATGHGTSHAPQIPVGIGVHTGLTFVGSVGSAEAFTDFTAVGDSVNTTARLASEARAGEILVSHATHREARLDSTHLECRSLALKGKAEPVEVWVVSGEPRFR